MKQLPAHIGREDFEQKSSSSIKLKQISRSFFTINNDMTIHFHPNNQTHFQFLDEKSEIINVHNNTLYKPIANNYKLKLASYDVIDGIFYSKTFQQKQPVIYDIKVSDMFDNFEFPIKRKRKEVEEEEAEEEEELPPPIPAATTQEEEGQQKKEITDEEFTSNLLSRNRSASFGWSSLMDRINQKMEGL